jgi:hypothetical protein
MSQRWESYEEVAAYLLDRFAQEFGLDRVEGKQDVKGHRSGTSWEIDAKGVRTSDGGFFIVECRRYTTSKQSQEKVGGLAYRIIDSGAAGGILVSPLGLQEGAEKVASAENIFSVRLDENSTRHQFTMQFLNKFMVGACVSLVISGHAEAKVVKAQGDDDTARD